LTKYARFFEVPNGTIKIGKHPFVWIKHITVTRS
jgi:hypothetical protein